MSVIGDGHELYFLQRYLSGSRPKVGAAQGVGVEDLLIGYEFTPSPAP